MVGRREDGWEERRWLGRGDLAGSRGDNLKREEMFRRREDGCEERRLYCWDGKGVVDRKNERRGRGIDSRGEEEIALKKKRLFLKEKDSLEGKEIIGEEKELLGRRKYY